MPHGTFATSPLEFAPLRDDAAEKKLMAALVPLLRKHDDVTRAYLARVHYDGKAGGMVLGLVTPGEDNEQLVAEIAKLFASLFEAGQHLDIIFVSNEQLAAIHKVAAAFYLRQGKALRISVFAIAAVEFLAWLATVVWAARGRPGFDIAGAHAILVFLVIPAVLIGAWGRWLPFALTLLGIGAWVGLSVLIGSQISN
jgi:hypothetical protein